MRLRQLALLTCAIPALLPFGGCASEVQQPPGELRTIVRFRTAVPAADPDTIRRMEQASGTAVSLSSLISDTEAAYWLKCTVQDPDCNDKMARLMTLPFVDVATPDRYRYPTEPSR